MSEKPKEYNKPKKRYNKPNKKYRNSIYFISACLIALGCWVLLVDILLRKDVQSVLLPDYTPLADDTAICFILAGITLILHCGKQRVQHLCLAMNTIIPVISILSLAEGFFIKIAPFLDRIELCMAPQTAACFIMHSIAYYNYSFKNRGRFVHVLLSLIALVGFIVVIGHLLNVPELHRLSSEFSMALYTAYGFIMLAYAGMLFYPGIGIVGLFAGKGIGNQMARVLFLQLFIVVMVTGYIRIIVHRQTNISEEFAIAIMVVIFVVISLMLVWNNALKVNRIEKQGKVALHNFKAAIEFAPYAMVISNKNGIIEFVNDQAENIFGYDKERFLGMHINKLMPPEHKKAYMAVNNEFFAFPVAKRLGFDEAIYAVKRKGGSFPVEIILTPIRSEGETLSLASIIDITERRQNEDIIKNQLKELHLKNAELEQFNYIASHDLQEPLRTLKNYILLLREDYPDRVEGDIDVHLQTMESSINRMSGLVQSLLEFGKLGLDKKLVLTDCSRLIGEVLCDLKGLIEESNASITMPDELPVLHVYEVQLRQLFQNLLNNAIKFRKPGVKPIIEVSCRENAGFVEFCISDNGIGISPGDYEKIFYVFQRLDNQEDFEGHGIGLANCKRIVELHGGKIWVESEPGIGSAFKFTLLYLK